MLCEVNWCGGVAGGIQHILSSNVVAFYSFSVMLESEASLPFLIIKWPNGSVFFPHHDNVCFRCRLVELGLHILRLLLIWRNVLYSYYKVMSLGKFCHKSPLIISRQACNLHGSVISLPTPHITDAVVVLSLISSLCCLLEPFCASLLLYREIF